MDIKITQTLEEYHKDIFADLEKAIKEGGRIGEAAKALKKIKKPHSLREELSDQSPLCPSLGFSTIQLDYDTDEATVMVDTLRSEILQMVDEHKKIIAAIDGLAVAARQDGKYEFLELVEKMRQHIEEEEQLYYRIDY
jgi:hypothetical protein